MRLVQTLIANIGFRDPSFNAERLALIGDLVRLARRVEAHLLILPAGVLTASAEGAVADRVAEVADLAGSADIAIVGGVDVADAPAKAARSAKGSVAVEDLVGEGRLPFFGFAVGVTPTPPDTRVWRQASTTAADAVRLDESGVPGPERVVIVADHRVGVLICGEQFNRRARERLASERPNLIVDLGHSGMGQGLIPAMRTLAAAGCPVAHAQHLANWWGRSLHYVSATGEQESSAVDPDVVLEGDRVWAAWAVRDV